MTEEVLTMAMESGIWVTLFVALLLYVLSDSRNRETKYQEVIKSNQLIINELSRKLNVVNDIQKNVCDIRDEIRRR